MDFKEARTNLREWSADLAALKDRVDVSIGKDGRDADAILAAWKKAQEGFVEACLAYVIEETP